MIGLRRPFYYPSPDAWISTTLGVSLRELPGSVQWRMEEGIHSHTVLGRTLDTREYASSPGGELGALSINHRLLYQISDKQGRVEYLDVMISESSDIKFRVHRYKTIGGLFLYIFWSLILTIPILPFLNRGFISL